MLRCSRLLRLLLFASLIALLVPQEEVLAATSLPANTSAHLSISTTAELAPDDPLQKWFTQQDHLMETLLMRLARVEILVREIHQLIMALPDGVKDTVAAPNQALPVSKDAEIGVLYIALGLLLIMLVLLVARRQHSPPIMGTRVSEPVSGSPGAHNETTLPPPPLLSDPISLSIDAAPPTVHGNPDQALELAEIMLSMGLGQGAAQTLIEQIRLEPKQALQHWLKLLEIYRHSNQKAEFERFSAELRQHFNIQAEPWSPTPEEHVQSIENYEHIATQLCKQWRQPDCLAYVQTLLNDNRGGTRNGFPQSVAEELLFLSALLRKA